MNNMITNTVTKDKKSNEKESNKVRSNCLFKLSLNKSVSDI